MSFNKSADDLEGLYNAAPFSRTDTKQYANALRNKKNKEFIQGSMAQEPSQKQIGYLSFLLGYEPSTNGLIAYVRFANGYYQGRLTRVHWMQAIALAKDGHNWYGNHMSLIRMSYEEID